MNLRQAPGPSTTARRVPPEEFPGHYRWRRMVPEALDPGTIADLSDSTVAGMTRDELVRMICAAELPLPLGFGVDRLRMQDQSTLERLAFLARRACRNRLTILGCATGNDEP